MTSSDTFIAAILLDEDALGSASVFVAAVISKNPGVTFLKVSQACSRGVGAAGSLVHPARSSAPSMAPAIAIRFIVPRLHFRSVALW